MPRGTRSGNLDLAVAEDEGLSGEVVQVLLGNGDGTFSAGASYGVDDAESIVAASLRKNGITDLAVAGLISPGPAILLGNGDGTFQQPVYYHLSKDALSLTVAVGDMNGDGIPDLVSAPTVVPSLTNYSAVCIFPGKGDGTFGPPEVSYPVASNSFPSGLALADFNGDHQLDATFSDQLDAGNGVGEYVLLKTGTVKFSPVSLVSFTDQKHGTTSPPQTVTLTNEGKESLSITLIKNHGRVRRDLHLRKERRRQNQLHDQHHVFAQGLGRNVGHRPDSRQRFFQAASHRPQRQRLLRPARPILAALSA